MISLICAAISGSDPVKSAIAIGMGWKLPLSTVIDNSACASRDIIKAEAIKPRAKMNLVKRMAVFSLHQVISKIPVVTMTIATTLPSYQM